LRVNKVAADTTSIVPEKGPDLPSIRAAKASLRLDGRTRLAKRQLALVRAYGDALGGWNLLNVGTRLKIEAAVEMQLVAELTRARFLAGEGANADDTVRTARAASQALKALGIDDRRKPAPPNLDQYLASKASAAAAATP
jgi:hypothetical protein